MNGRLAEAPWRLPRTRVGAHLRRTGALPLSALLLAPLACAEGADPDEASVVRRDSAGVEVVETRRAGWPEGGGWTLSPEPELVIGLTDGEAPYLLSDVTGALRLDDGRVVIADGQSRELRFFASDGTFMRAVGGVGEGPSEFPSSLFALERCGADRLYAHDIVAQRVVSWSTTGEFQRSFRLMEPGAARRPYAVACTGDGGFVGIGWGLAQERPQLPAGAEAMMYTQVAPVWVLDSLSAPVKVLGTFLSSERILLPNGSGPHPFGRATRFTASGSRIYLGTGEGFEVGVYDGGELVRIQRSLTEALTIDRSWLDAYFAAELDGIEAQARDLVERAGSAFPPELPGYVALRASPDGHLWAMRFALPGETSNRWGVFAPDGVFLGNLELPEGLRVMDVGDDYLLGVVRDVLEVERVHLYRIGRESGAT